MPHTPRRGIVVVLSATLLSAIGHAAVLHVPGDYAHIQNAIDAGTNGDVILVSPGVYNENINFKGKAVTVTSTNTADPNVVKSTIIHASGQSSVVSFITGESLELGAGRLYDHRRLRDGKSCVRHGYLLRRGHLLQRLLADDCR